MSPETGAPAMTGFGGAVFEGHPIPTMVRIRAQVSHGMCPECFTRVTNEDV